MRKKTNAILFAGYDTCYGEQEKNEKEDECYLIRLVNLLPSSLPVGTGTAHPPLLS